MDSLKLKLLREKLRQFEFNISWRLKEETVCCGITLSQCQTLMEIGNRNEVSIVELARILGLDSSSLSRTINGMVNTGLVNRILNPSDRRYVSLTLTKQGKNLYDEIDGKYDRYYSKVFEFIPEEKRELVIDSFLIFADAIKTCKEYHNCCKYDNNEGRMVNCDDRQE